MLQEKKNLNLDFYLAGIDEVLDNKPFYKRTPPSFAPTPQKKTTASEESPKALSIDLDQVTSLQGLKEALKNYDGCSFSKLAKNLVFGEGHEQADVMLVGEAPGADEDREGRPFVGRSGKLLEAMMNMAGFTRKDYYITNVIFWRPPANRQPTPEDVASCSLFTTKQIRLIKPKIILALGSVATKSLTGMQLGITRMRGNYYALESDPHVLVLPTFHPANLLRTPLNKRYVWQDILKLKHKMAEFL